MKNAPAALFPVLMAWSMMPISEITCIPGQKFKLLPLYISVKLIGTLFLFDWEIVINMYHSLPAVDIAVISVAPEHT